MIKMIASRAYYHKPDRREYAIGEEFSVASEDEADRLERRKRARRVEMRRHRAVDLPKAAMPMHEPKKDEEPADEMAILREQYHTLLGKRPFNGWDETELRNRMAEYQRSDMRAGSGEYRTTAMEAEE